VKLSAVWEMIQERGCAAVEYREIKMLSAAAPALGSSWHQPPLLHLGMGGLSLERKKRIGGCEPSNDAQVRKEPTPVVLGKEKPGPIRKLKS